MPAKWVYRVSDGVFLRGGFYDPAHDAETEGVAIFKDNHPDVVTERYAPDAQGIHPARPATPNELAAVVTAHHAETAEAVFAGPAGPQLLALMAVIHARLRAIAERAGTPAAVEATLEDFRTAVVAAARARS